MGRIDTTEMDGAGSRPVSRAELETEPALLKGREAKSGRIPSRTTEPLATPMELWAKVPGTETARRTVAAGREAVRRILAGKDQRLLVVAGPCSVHDEVAALDYAGRLRELSHRVSDSLLLVMRAYVEKPRTHLGWKGLAVDPRLDGSDELGEGLLRSRRFFNAVNAMGLPVATEFVGPATPAYLGDLVSWAAIGARTTESQTHREMASGLPCPVGFKNATDGRLAPAINGIRSARSPHQFPGLTPDGRAGLIQTGGNPHAHLVLRGGRRPNHDLEGVAEARSVLSAANLPTRVVVDCSHGNSGKDHRRQPGVLRELVARRAGGERDIAGVMLESFLVPGKQALSAKLANLRYGQSVTDGCVGWEETEALLLEARDRLRSAGKVIPFSQREPGECLLWTGS
jgi:3-deoxy-7-phosphoheptulonate synthase